MERREALELARPRDEREVRPLFGEADATNARLDGFGRLLPVEQYAAVGAVLRDSERIRTVGIHDQHTARRHRLGELALRLSDGIGRTEAFKMHVTNRGDEARRRRRQRTQTGD